jgi:hypothetical protein
VDNDDIRFVVPARLPRPLTFPFLRHGEDVSGYLGRLESLASRSETPVLRLTTGLSCPLQRMTGKGPVDLALLLTSVFTASVGEYYVEVGLYTSDVMHMEQI